MQVSENGSQIQIEISKLHFMIYIENLPTDLLWISELFSMHVQFEHLSTKTLTNEPAEREKTCQVTQHENQSMNIICSLLLGSKEEVTSILHEGHFLAIPRPRGLLVFLVHIPLLRCTSTLPRSLAPHLAAQ